MLNLLLKMNLLTEEEYKSILEIVLEESESVLLTAKIIQKRCNIRWIVSNSCDIVVLQKQNYRKGRKNGSY